MGTVHPAWDRVTRPRPRARPAEGARGQASADCRSNIHPGRSFHWPSGQRWSRVSYWENRHTVLVGRMYPHRNVYGQWCSLCCCWCLPHMDHPSLSHPSSAAGSGWHPDSTSSQTWWKQEVFEHINMHTSCAFSEVYSFYRLLGGCQSQSSQTSQGVYTVGQLQSCGRGHTEVISWCWYINTSQ